MTLFRSGLNIITISNLLYLNVISVDEKANVIGYVFKHVFKELTSKNVGRSFNCKGQTSHTKQYKFPRNRSLTWSFYLVMHEQNTPLLLLDRGTVV